MNKKRWQRYAQINKREKYKTEIFKNIPTPLIKQYHDI